MTIARIHDYDAAITFGDTPVYTDTSAPGADEVLVRVAAASLNPLDVLLHSGKRREVFPLTFPYTPGTDLAGTVVRAGALAARWRPGDRVVARLDPTRGGALADYAMVPATYLAAIAPHVSFDDAAALPTAAGTAWQALFDVAHLTRGQTVLVHAGAGGVGSFAIQLARRVGAQVIATASGDGIELAHRLGADQVIDYRSENFAERLSGNGAGTGAGVDVVLDTLGGDTQQRSYGVIRPGGKLVALTATPDDALAKAHQVDAVWIGHASHGGRLGLIAGLLDAGLLKPLIDRRVPLDDLVDALAHQASGRARGKIVVTLS